MNAYAIACIIICAPVDALEVSELDGEWILESWISDGASLNVAKHNLPDRLIIKGERAKLFRGDTTHTDNLKYHFSKRADFYEFSVSYVGDDPALKSYYDKSRFHGIVKVSGSSLIRCYTVGASKLPKAFRSTAGCQCELQKFVRMEVLESGN